MSGTMISEATAARAPHETEFVLATDLDGTFLGGSDEDRARFYRWIENNRDRVGLIFVTGRDPGYISFLTKREGGSSADTD